MPAPALATLARNAGGALSKQFQKSASKQAGGAAKNGSSAKLGGEKGPKALTAQILSFAMKDTVLTLSTASFGLSLIYANLHLVGRYVAHSKLFSDFGQALRFGKTKVPVGKAAEYAEIALVLTLDLIVFAVLLSLTTILFLMIWPFFDLAGFCRTVGPVGAAAVASLLGPLATMGAGATCFVLSAG